MATAAWTSDIQQQDLLSIYQQTLTVPTFIPIASEGIWINIKRVLMNQLIIILEKFRGWIKHQTWCSRCTTNRHLFNELFSARRWRLELYSHALNVKCASLDLVERGKDKTWCTEPYYGIPNTGTQPLATATILPWVSLLGEMETLSRSKCLISATVPNVSSDKPLRFQVRTGLFESVFFSAGCGGTHL